MPPAILLAATAAAIAPAPTPVLGGATLAGQAGEAVLLFPANPGAAAPAEVDAALVLADGSRRAVALVRTGPAGLGGAPRSFVPVRYRFPVAGIAGAGARLELASGSAFALAATPAPPVAVAAAAPGVAGAAASAAPAPGFSADRQRPGNPFLANLSAYAPTYAVLGRGTGTDGRIQLSFKYQLFGDAAHPAGDWKEGFHFGYTQRMFWDLGAHSAPFRDVDYQPELFYSHAWPSSGRVRLSARGGYLHQSNGRSGDESRAFNILYLQPIADVALGAYTLSVGPRVFAYVAGRDGNEDIARYRGHQALSLAIGRDDGLKLSTVSRINFSTGKGAIDGELSYPLDRLLGVPLYVTVQGFTGYGEDLLDYDRRQTRLRVGIGIVR